ncbi:MAG: tetratricopeptide repeat protein [Mariprofundus sp.]
MLAASASTPNTHSANSIPKPVNWRGVSEGMSAALAAARKGKLETAEVILLDVLEFAPAETRAWKLLARIQRNMGHIEAGIASATRALQLQALNKLHEPAASLTLARLFHVQGEHREALQMLDRLIEKDPDNSELKALKEKWSMEAPA